MKKNVIKKLVVLVACMAMVLGVPAVCMAAERGEPVDKVIASDGKTHTVYVFGTSLALESTDGSINVSPIGGLTGVDVMIDGVITKNVRALDAPAGQKTKLGLEEGSVYVKNVTPEIATDVKQQISNAYAAGAVKVDIASLGNVVAYQVNESGKMENAAGVVVDSAAIGGAVTTTEQTYSNFVEQIKESEAVMREARIAEEKAKEAREATDSSPSSPSSSVSGNSI